MPIEKQNLESSARLILDSAMARFLPKDIDQVPTTIRRIIQGFEVVANYQYVRGLEHIEWLRDQYRQMQSEDHSLPLLFAFNHTGKSEVFRVIEFAINIAGRADRLFLPVSEDYTDEEIYYTYSKLVETANAVGIQTFPIRQSYLDRKGILIADTVVGKIPNKIREAKIESRGKPLKLLKSIKANFSAGNIFIIATEGKRNPQGWLMPAEEGAGLAVASLKHLIEEGKVPDAYVVPIGIDVLPKKFLDYRSQYGMTVGQPLTPLQISEKSSALAEKYDIPLRHGQPSYSLLSHALMMEIADLLLESNRGVYHEGNPYFLEVLQDRIRIGSDSEGRVGLLKI